MLKFLKILFEPLGSFYGINGPNPSRL